MSAADPTVSIPAELAGLFQQVKDLLPDPLPANISLARGMLHALDEVARTTADSLRRGWMEDLLQKFHQYFQSYSADNPETNHGLVWVQLAPDHLTASVTLTPPRENGNVPTFNKVLAELDAAGVKFGIEQGLVEAALEVVLKQNDVAWQSIVARGTPPVRGRPTRMEFTVPFIDKGAMRMKLDQMVPALENLGPPVKAGQRVGRMREPELGVPGRDVFGKWIAPLEGHARALEFGEDLKLKDDQLHATGAGYVVVDEFRVELMPLYAMEHPGAHATGEFTFPGAVLVKGPLRGPYTIHCEDLYVLGNCELVDVFAEGDVLVAGGILGRRQTQIEADGRVYASFFTEARVSAMGEVCASNAVVNSTIASNDAVRVRSPKGLITGGSVQALREVVAATIGSEFGLLTETIVGRDFLTPQRLKDIQDRIQLHEENLRRIEELKQQIAKARVRLESMPPEKQEIYIGVLRKESRSQAELKSLLRRRNNLARQLGDFLAASIQVLDAILPPVRVQIVDQIREIEDRLSAVILKYDTAAGGITSEARTQGEPVP